MKRLTAVVLSWLVVLGAFPADAQVVLGRAALTGVSAPTPVPSGLAPAVGSALAPSLSAAPALALSIAPAAAAPVPVLAAPALAAAPVPAAAAPVAAAVPAPTPIAALKAAASVPEAAAPAFDGGRLAAASTPDPVDPGGRARTPAKRSLLQRYKDSRKDSTPKLTAFAKGAFAGSMAALAVPPLLSMAPALKIGYAIAFTNLALFALLVPAALTLWAARKLRASPEAARPPPSRRKLAATLAVGLLFGAGLGVTPYHATGPVVERVEMYIDRNRPAAEQERVRWISGGAAEAETIEMLSGNPVGRATLDALRDRFGVVRMPSFFLSRQDGSYAEHSSVFDGVYLNENEVTSRGWTVERFLKDPALQRRLVREMSSTILHELTHAVQGRRSPLTPGYFLNTIEAEQEAFFQEMLYIVASLEADKSAKNDGADQWMIIEAAAGIDGFLKSVADMYEKNVVVGNDPHFNAYIAAQRARWPAYRVRLYLLLSERASTPFSAKMYLEKARAAAKEAGLPDPAADSVVSR